jgi:hypothetical protein
VFHYAPLRDGSPGGFLVRVTLPSGQELSFPDACRSVTLWSMPPS